MKSKVKILFDTSNRINMVCVNAITYFERAVGKIANCKWTREHKIPDKESEHEKVLRVMPDADWVFHAGMGYVPPPPSERTYKIGLFTPDIHRSVSLKLKPAGLIKRWNDAKFDAYFMSYIKLANQAFPIEPIDPDIYLKNLEAPIFHLAPSVSPEVFNPSGEPKQYDIVFLAHAHPTTHPFRYQIHEGLPRLAQKHNWKILIGGRPPGKTAKRVISKMLQEGYIVGPKYAEVLARSKAFIFGLGSFKYPCLKFMEGWASGTCTFSDPPLGYEELHFVPDWNFVDINPKNWEKKLVYYMKHDEEREEIAQNGYDTFLKHYTSDVRAKQFVKFLEEHM